MLSYPKHNPPSLLVKVLGGVEWEGIERNVRVVGGVEVAVMMVLGLAVSSPTYYYYYYYYYYT